MAKDREQAEHLYDHGSHVKACTTIMRSPQDLYAAWRGLSDLPRFIDHLEKVEALDDRRSRWSTKGPAGSTLSWDAEIIRDEPGKRIVWRSLPGSQIENAGTIEFTPISESRGTRVDVTFEYVPPAGKLGAALAKASGEGAKKQARNALHRFRQVMETGEAATVIGQPVGEGGVHGPDDERRTDSNLHDIAEGKQE